MKSKEIYVIILFWNEVDVRNVAYDLSLLWVQPFKTDLKTLTYLIVEIF